MNLGQLIVKLRKRRNLKQGELAEKLGITQRQLLRWEKDEVRPRPKSIEDLASVLGVSLEELTSEPAAMAVPTVDDPELEELLVFVPQLEPSRLATLKNILRDMVTCQQISRLTARAAS